MKTRLFLAALAGVALASCVTDKEYDVPAQNENVKIAFDSPVMYDNDTRANYYGEVGSHQYTQGGTIYSYPREEDFVVYAVKHAGSFNGWSNAEEFVGLNGSQVDFDQSLDGWATSIEYNWPAGQFVTFAATSPANLEQTSGWEGRSYGATGLTLTNFKVPANAANHFDLMFSKRALNQSLANMNQSASYYSGVPIQFQHALSSIHFSLKNETTKEVVLKKISLFGVYDTGTFNEGIDESQGVNYVRNTNVNPTWTPTGATTLPQTEAYIPFDATGKAGVTFPKNAQYISNLIGTSTTMGDNHVLLVMPQVLTNAAKLIVEYTVQGSPATKTVILNSAPTLTAGTEDYSGQHITEWVMGTRYTYRLYYSAESASEDKIYFAPSSDGWQDALTAVIELKNPDTIIP